MTDEQACDLIKRYLRFTRYTCFYDEKHKANIVALWNRIHEKHGLDGRYTNPGTCGIDFLAGSRYWNECYVGGERIKVPKGRMHLMKQIRDASAKIETVSLNAPIGEQ